NTICKEGRYSELGTKHKDLVTAMETDDLQERLLRFDEVMESQCPLFKFAQDYMKFVMCILMFIRTSREGDCDAITNRYNENVQKLKDVLKASDPFATEERHLVNIVTKAVMPDDIKEGVLTRDKIGQELFDTFAQERIVEAKFKCLEPHEKGKSEVMEVCL
ncbi:unnamed protein product, partial [Porites evermanni]